MLEPVIDALLGEDALDEGPVRLPGLGAIGARSVAGRGCPARFVGGDTGLVEHLLHDLDRRHLLEDAAVPPERERGHRRPEREGERAAPRSVGEAFDPERDAVDDERLFERIA